MKISEIQNVSTGGVDLNKIDRNNEQPFGWNDGKDIAGFQMYKNKYKNYDVYYLVDDTDEIVAATVTFTVDYNHTSYIKIQGVYVDPAERGNNLALYMYHTIMHTEKKNLMSDEKQTDDGRKLWEKIIASPSFNVAVMDIVTGKIISDDPEDAYDSYYDNDEHDRTVLVTRATLKENILIPHLILR